MADLRYIMHMEDDGDPGNDKYSRRPNHFGSARSSNPSSMSTGLDGNHQPTDNTDPSESLPRRRDPLNRSPRSSTTPSFAIPTRSSDSSSPSRTRFFEQRSIDITRPVGPPNYGKYPTSSSPSNMQPSSRTSLSSRPVVNVPGEANLPVKLTPITGRVSRAKKGVPVHTCEICKPPKIFTRAEHLRRHQLSHRPATFQCPYPRCDKAFFRHDLLTRHVQRHEQDDGSGMDVRRSTSRQSSHPQLERTTSSTDYFRATMPGDNLAMAEEFPGHLSYTSRPPPYSPSHRSSISGPGPLSPSIHSPRSHSTGHTHSHSEDQGYILATAPHMPQMGYYDSSIGSHHYPGKVYRQAFQPRRSPSFAYMGLESLATELPNLAIPDSDPVGRLCAESNWPSSGSDSPYSTPHKVAARGCSSPNADASDALFFVNPQFPSSQHAVYQQIAEFATPYADEPGYFEFTHPFPVRSPTPPTVVLSTQPAEHLVTIGHSVPEPSAILGRQKAFAALLTPYSDTAFLTAQVSSAAALNAIPRYLAVYWKRFDTLFPLIHRRTSETSASHVLRSAMAAVGAQFLPSEEDRLNSQILHDFALEEIGHYSRWNVQVMQAILLCEFYDRFRGSRVLSRPSKPFQSLYSRVANPLNSDYHDFPSRTTHGRWDKWVVAESYRRLLAVCFVLDVHSSMYHEHSTMLHDINPKSCLPLTKSTQHLWEAQDAEEWEDLLTSQPSEPEAISLVDGEVTADLVAAAPPLDLAVYLALETTRLPRRSPPSTMSISADLNLGPAKRMWTLFPRSAVANTYLALQFTPLRDVLAVSGDSWLFSRKILDLEDFQRRKASVRSWSKSIHAGAASTFAAKALLIFLDLTHRSSDSQNSTAGSQQGAGWNTPGLSDYWALYVCALICWALGHRAMTRGNAGSSHASEPASDKATCSAAEWWLNMMARSTPEAAMQNVHGQRETLNVVSVVKRKLEGEIIGSSKNKLPIDTVRVLRCLVEDPHRRRF